MSLTSLLSWFDSGTPRQNYIRHKSVHALVGITLCLIGQHIGYPWEAATLAFFLGVGKEMWDVNHGGAFRAGDVAWTCLPGAVLLLILR